MVFSMHVAQNKILFVETVYLPLYQAQKCWEITEGFLSFLFNINIHASQPIVSTQYLQQFLVASCL